MEQRRCPTCDNLLDPATDFFHWKLEREIIELIRVDHPDWEVRNGICMRCVEEYRSVLASKDIRKDLAKLDQMERELVRKIAQRLHLSKNINEVYEEGLTFGERAADRLAQFGGSWTFIFIFTLVLVAWMTVNTAALARPFDPYPYILLNLVLSSLAAIQAPIILMSQNRLAEKDRLRAENDYEVNLKAELEIQQLHEKLDELRMRSWQELWQIQMRQVELLENLTGSVEEGKETKRS
ncbi:MAG: DUF1003 domain-containing protein [Deltaproteobacteria bacterium]|nr:DUF1003 domain-containing protein [Deltaproteobacteria bacterium]